MHRTDYELKMTCGACPEQYDVYLDGCNVGYLRLRHGYFRAEHVPSQKVVYSGEPDGDGIFEDYERNTYLNAAIAALDEFIHTQEDDDDEREEGEPVGWTLR